MQIAVHLSVHLCYFYEMIHKGKKSSRGFDDSHLISFFAVEGYDNTIFYIILFAKSRLYTFRESK